MSRSAEVESSVTADDLDQAVQLAVAALQEAPPEGWERKAGPLEWSCWETIEHLSDDLFAYAAQLGPRKPPMSGEVPFLAESQRSGGPENAIYADRSAGPDGLLQVLEASAALLAAMVRTTPSHVMAHHVYGASDPEGFAAMGRLRLWCICTMWRRDLRSPGLRLQSCARGCSSDCFRTPGVDRSLAHPVVGHRPCRVAWICSANCVALGRNTPVTALGRVS